WAPQSDEVELPKNDVSSVASILSLAQANLTRGKVREQYVDKSSLQQAFTIGGGASGGTAAAASGGGTGSGTSAALEAVYQKLEAAEGNSESHKELQKEFVAVLPRIEVAKVAELMGRAAVAIGAVEGRIPGWASSLFLDEVLRALLASGLSRFGSPHLAKVLGALSAWTASAAGGDADGRPKLSEDTPHSRI
ncbi:unnamed protein product, partial [Polarella glacialis]